MQFQLSFKSMIEFNGFRIDLFLFFSFHDSVWSWEFLKFFEVLKKSGILEPQIESWVETDTQVRKGDLQWGYDRHI